jgi:hypothetical protein
MMLYWKLVFTVDVLFFYFKFELPFKIVDLKAFDMFFLWIPDSEMWCHGAKAQYLIGDMLPVVKENVADCSYSFLSRMTGDRDWWNTNGAEFILECRGSYTRTGTFYNREFGNANTLVNAPQFGYNFDHEDVFPLPYFGFTLVEDYFEFYRFCIIKGEYLEL